mmetsp:Transcript_8379/g.35009  ORF Transcript_8379/g.35009 Transcript_8379/m.35009 type:complete len:221 (-) Transcript_8379:801-1463(-)
MRDSVRPVSRVRVAAVLGAERAVLAEPPFPPLGFELAQRFLDLEVILLHVRTQVADLVVVEHAKLAQTLHVRLLRRPARQLVVLLDDLAERLDVERDVRLEHVRTAVGLRHRAAKQTRVRRGFQNQSFRVVHRKRGTRLFVILKRINRRLRFVFHRPFIFAVCLMKASFQFPRERARARDARERAAPSCLDAPRAIRGAALGLDEISRRATRGAFQMFQL